MNFMLDCEVYYDISSLTMLNSKVCALLIVYPSFMAYSSDEFNEKRNIGEVRKNAGGASTPIFAHALDSKMELGEIFSIVKRTVRMVTGKEREGVGLMLASLPATLGAFWEVGGNYIVVNEVLLEAMRRHCSNPREFNAFVYVILTHEYLHSIGYLDELSARKVTAQIARRCFGEEHEAWLLSSGDIWEIYPFLKYLPGGTGERLKVVTNFDPEATRGYIY